MYCVSVTGVTGARENMSATLSEYIARIRSHTDLPLAIGFGISKPEHVTQVGEIADGAIVGAALINALNTVSNAEMPAKAAEFVRYLRGVDS